MAGLGPQSLEGVRVVEFADPKVALCGKLLADMGADVVLVEPPTGAGLRGLPPHAGDSGEGLLFWYTCSRKRSVTIDLGGPEGIEALRGLIRAADVVLDPFKPGYLPSLGLTDEAVLEINPSVIFASLTDFGQTGPFRDYAGSDIVGWAMSGLMSLTGDPDQEPLTAPALQGYQCASLWATIAVQAALYRRLKTGQGARIDLSVQEALFDMSETAHSFYLCNQQVVKRNSGDHPLACPFRVFPSRDGHAFIGLSSQQQWRNALAWMKEHDYAPPELQDPALDQIGERQARRQEVNRFIAGFALRVGHEELFVHGAELGIPNAPVRPAGDNLDDEQLQARAFFGELVDPRPEMSGRRYPLPGLPFQGKEGPWTHQPGKPPRLGEHTAQVVEEWAAPTQPQGHPSADPRRLPLEGVSVMDLCWNIAGPVVGRILADLGADVVKVEPREVGDPSRMLAPFPGGIRHQNHSYTFHDINRDKRSVTIDMKREGAREVALELARWADVMLENFTSGTVQRLGIGYEAVSQANPRIIMGSLCGYGQKGPRASWPSYHPTSAALSGLTALFAYEGGEPQGFGHSHMDYTAGYLCAIGVIDALMRRERTGKGDHVDISQLECGVGLAGTQLLDWAVNRHHASPEGNRAGALGAILQGCYRCAGDDQWLVVTAPDRQALESVASLVGAASGGTTEAVEQALAAWAVRQKPWDAFELLQQAGIAAGVVSHGPDLAQDRHLKAREAVASVPHPELERVPIVQCPIVMDGNRLAVRRAGPLLGEHTEQVLRETLGMSEDRYLDYVVREIV